MVAAGALVPPAFADSTAPDGGVIGTSPCPPGEVGGTVIVNGTPITVCSGSVTISPLPTITLSPCPSGEVGEIVWVNGTPTGVCV